MLEDYGLIAWPKTSGSRGFHIYARIAPRWPFRQVRLAAQTVAREVERRAPDLATSRWWKEEREGVFVDFNQNAKDRTVASAYSVRATPDARVSTPLHWDEVADCRPEAFTIATVPGRFAEIGDPWAGMDDAVGELDRLLMLAEELGPPEKRAEGREAGGKAATAGAVSSMPLIEIARTKTKDEAMAALDTWRDRHPAGGRPAAAGRRPGRRHARAEFDLVPDPDQPAARAGRPATAAGGADRRLQPLGRGLGPAPWLLSLIRERTASASASGSERPVCGPCRRVVLVTVVGGEQRPKPIGGAWAQEFEDPSTQLVYLLRPALEGMRHATAALFSPDHAASDDIGAAYLESRERESGWQVRGGSSGSTGAARSLTSWRAGRTGAC